MVRLFKIGELLLYLVACCYAAYRGAMELRISATETQPAAFTAADFAARHRGEQWVRVVGRVAMEHRRVQPSPYEAHEGKNLAYVTAPVVAPDWGPQQPVEVLATFGPISQASVEAWSQSLPATPQPVEGQLRPSGFRNPQEMFPRLRISPSYVVINEGTRPNRIGAMIGFLTLMVAFATLLAWRIRSTWQQPSPQASWASATEL